ncbi:thioredoxin family protein [Prolixibacteraceae bacterium JC049]|nr:thioredoxin family protein [Prolixibacteraceae bacterium JC049]
MALTPSNMLELGTQAPSFQLLNVKSSNIESLENLQSDKATVIAFICNHCPYVKHINTGLIELANDYMAKGISFIGISANDADNYPEDSPEKMKEMPYPFPYLYDESQDIAKAYDAACTPDFYVFDKEMNLVYRGQMDDSRPGNGIEVTGKDIAQVLELLLKGETVPAEGQRPSIGCNIKWK